MYIYVYTCNHTWCAYVYILSLSLYLSLLSLTFSFFLSRSFSPFLSLSLFLLSPFVSPSFISSLLTTVPVCDCSMYSHRACRLDRRRIKRYFVYWLPIEETMIPRPPRAREEIDPPKLRDSILVSGLLHRLYTLNRSNTEALSSIHTLYIKSAHQARLEKWGYADDGGGIRNLWPTRKLYVSPRDYCTPTLRDLFGWLRCTSRCSPSSLLYTPFVTHALTLLFSLSLSRVHSLASLFYPPPACV